MITSFSIRSRQSGDGRLRSGAGEQRRAVRGTRGSFRARERPARGGQLERSHAKILGFVLNEVPRESGYYGYRKYGYRRYGYGRGYGYGHGYGYGYGQEKPDSGERSIP